MNQGLISVIVPIYQVAEYLDRCVASIVNQTYPHLEIILVDDGSPDACGAMCDAWAQKDPRIKVIHKPNGGLSDARNAGLDLATGEFIAFVDGDDFVHPQYLAILWQNLQATDSDLSLCSYCSVNDQQPYHPDLTNNYAVYDGTDAITDLLLVKKYCNTIVAWTKLYRRHIFANGLRFAVGRLHEDEFIAHQVYAACQRVVLCFAQLYHYYQRPASITQQKKFTARNLDAFYALEARYQYFATTKWRQVALNLVVGGSAYVYCLARQKHADPQYLKLLKSKFREYYRLQQHKKWSHYLFRFSPTLYYWLTKLKNCHRPQP